MASCDCFPDSLLSPVTLVNNLCVIDVGYAIGAELKVFGRSAIRCVKRDIEVVVHDRRGNQSRPNRCDSDSNIHGRMHYAA